VQEQTGYTERIVRAISRVVVERVVRAPFAAALDYAEGFFRQAAEGTAVGVPLRFLVPTLGGRLQQPVQIQYARRPDQAEPGRAHDAFEVCWTAGSPFFPDFRGTLRLRIASVDETRLSLEGEYRPPLGLLGAVFDALAGRWIARATLSDFLDRLAGAMERGEAAFRGA
jgi:hypothetical protein